MGFQKSHLISSGIAYAKDKHFSQLCFNATTLNSQSLVIENFCILFNCPFTKLSQLRLFRMVDMSLALEILKQTKKKAVANSKGVVKISCC